MHRLILYPRNPTGQLPATRAVGRVLAELPNLVRDAVAGAMGPSRGITGRGPGWLARAADVRIEGIDRSAPDRPAFLLSAPPLGEAASDQFSQRTLFPELSPNRDDTGLDVLNNTLRSLFHPEMGHPPLSLGLMRRLLRLTNALAATSELKGFALDTPKRGGRPLSMVNSDLIEVVRMQLEERTETTLVEFIGSIDRLELDAGQFRVTSDRNERIWCDWDHRGFKSLHLLWGCRVRIRGAGHFSSTGKLRRVTVERLSPLRPEEAKLFEMALNL